jgi:hypothetical protein
MKLSVAERLALLNVLPREGNIGTLRIVRDLQKELEFTEQDQGRLQMNFSEDGKTVEWKAQFDVGKDIEVGPRALEIIRKGFESISEQGVMPMNYLPIYDRVFESVHEDK